MIKSKGIGTSGNLQVILFFAAILNFEESCFMLDTILIQSLGIGKKKACLKSDAVLILFTKPTIT